MSSKEYIEIKLTGYGPDINANYKDGDNIVRDDETIYYKKNDTYEDIGTLSQIRVRPGSNNWITNMTGDQVIASINSFSEGGLYIKPESNVDNQETETTMSKFRGGKTKRRHRKSSSKKRRHRKSSKKRRHIKSSNKKRRY
jgi:hypothetical protein